MDLFAVISFLILYYLRPQEWPLGLGAFHFVQNTMLIGLASLFVRERGFQLRDLFRTPHDWAVLVFWLYIVFSTGTPWTTFKETVSLYIFYIVIVQTLYSVPRLNKFVGWWTFLICGIAGLALLSVAGVDPLYGKEIVDSSMKGRLMLNLSIFNNPHALGHSVVPAIPLLYYFCFWKKPVALRVLGVALMVMASWCIYLTQSKGAFLSGAATILATLTFGRPKTVQAIIIVAALLFGGPAVSLLPRMSELKKAKTDEAIQGRVMAFKHGYKMLTTTDFGVGYHGWMKSFLAGKYRFKQTKIDENSRNRPMPIVSKSSHSSWVCIGAELGRPGFFLHMGILFCCLRTLATSRTATPDEERIRRILFALIISYMVSSWMVNFEYRATFFMFAAATAALHRHLLGLDEERERVRKEDTEESPQPALPAWRARLIPQPALEGAFARMGAPVAVLTMEPESSPPPQTQPASKPEPEAEPEPVRGIAFSWNRIGWVDLALTLAMTYAAIRYWAHLITKM